VGVHSADIFVKIVNVQCVGHVLRFLNFLSASLPGPAPHCQPGAPLYRTSWTVYEIFTRRSRVHTEPNCGDLVFSGHTFQVTSFCVIMLANMPGLLPPRYQATVGRFLSTVLISTVLVIPYFILAARNHFTVDVVIALYVAPMTWWALEGFYTTATYRSGCSWWDRHVPHLVRCYLNQRDRCGRPTVAAVMAATEQRHVIRHLVDKYRIEASETQCLLDAICASGSGKFNAASSAAASAHLHQYPAAVPTTGGE
jgi:PAP2 superfamily C-terminal